MRAASWWRFSKHPENISKKRAGREALLKKLCRPYFPEKFGFDFD
jgi:hypothetical protein